MTKDEARNYLNKWLSERYDESQQEMRLPIVDEVVLKEIGSDNTLSNDIRQSTTITEWTFKGLIKLAYDL